MLGGLAIPVDYEYARSASPLDEGSLYSHVLLEEVPTWSNARMSTHILILDVPRACLHTGVYLVSYALRTRLLRLVYYRKQRR